LPIPEQARHPAGDRPRGVNGLVILHTDIPTHAQVSRMLDVRNRASVSIYVSTDPVSGNVGERIELGNLAAEAMTQLDDALVAKRKRAAIEQELGDLIEKC
jgi:hypothetical protein